MIKKNCTFGDKYGPAMEMTDQAQADAYFEEMIQHNMAESGHTREQAIEIEKSNLGYYAGYYSNEVRARVEQLFRCHHPIFGAIAHRKPPTPEEALKMGMEMGKKMKQQKAVEQLRQKRNKVKKAFTLIELMVVIAIIVLLAAMIVPALKQAQKKAELRKRQGTHLQERFKWVQVGQKVTIEGIGLSGVIKEVLDSEVLKDEVIMKVLVLYVDKTGKANETTFDVKMLTPNYMP